MKHVKTDRSLLVFILLTFVTCGVYQFYNIYAIACDTNELCKGDGRDTPGLLLFILFSLLTCGIYSFVWYYQLGERLSFAGFNKQVHTAISGSTLLLWQIVGRTLCGIGPFVAMNIIYSALNNLAYAHNQMFATVNMSGRNNMGNYML